MPVLLHPSEWINWPLLKEPLNWLIVGTVASIWLMAFHAVMTGFSAMQSGGSGQAIGGGGPGTIAAPLADVTTRFSVAGQLGSGYPLDTSTSWFGADNIWSDDFQAKFAEDGWTGNP